MLCNKLKGNQLRKIVTKIAKQPDELGNKTCGVSFRKTSGKLLFETCDVSSNCAIVCRQGVVLPRARKVTDKLLFNVQMLGENCRGWSLCHPEMGPMQNLDKQYVLFANLW